MNLLSGVRLGVGLKLIPSLRVETLNRIMIFSQSAHLQHAARAPLAEGEADVRRASFVRSELAGEERGGPEGAGRGEHA
jgi:protein arginine kinase